MAIIIKGKTFTSTEQVTSTKLHQLVDDATFDAAAADGSTLEVSAGALRVKDAGITGDKLSATVAIPTGATAVTQAADTDTTAVATCAFAKAEADAGETAAKAFAIQRANHTGTQSAATITGLPSPPFSTSQICYWSNNVQKTAGRAGNTVYQNTSGRTRFVVFAYTFLGALVYVDNVNGSTTEIGFCQAGGAAPWNTISFMVPTGYYYQIAGVPSTYYAWTEWD